MTLTTEKANQLNRNPPPRKWISRMDVFLSDDSSNRMNVWVLKDEPFT